MSDLNPFVDALRKQTMGRLQAHAPARDVFDAVDRARALDEKAVPDGLRETLIDEAPSYAPDAPDADLEPFAAALRERAGRQAEQRRLTALPEPPRPRVWAWTAIVAVAAVVGLTLLLPQLSSAPTQDNSATSLEEAERSSPAPRDSGEVSERARPRRAGAQESKSEPAPPTVDPPPPAPEASATEPDKKAQPRLDDLEARAHTRWKSGDLKGAEKALRAVIRRAGRSRRAELAFADLFAVARQRGGATAQAKVWRGYLAKFPRGRFADESRAGLCRRAAGEQRLRCWTTYLEFHPQGSHAGAARKAVGTAGD